MAIANGGTAKNGAVLWRWVAGVAISVIFGSGGYSLGYGKAAARIASVETESARKREVLSAELGRRIDVQAAEVNSYQGMVIELGSSQRSLIAAVARDRNELLEALARIDNRLTVLSDQRQSRQKNNDD